MNDYDKHVRIHPRLESRPKFVMSRPSQRKVPRFRLISSAQNFWALFVQLKRVLYFSAFIHVSKQCDFERPGGCSFLQSDIRKVGKKVFMITLARSFHYSGHPLSPIAPTCLGGCYMGFLQSNSCWYPQMASSGHSRSVQSRKRKTENVTQV